MAHIPLENFKIMTHLNYHNHYTKNSKQKSLDAMDLSEIERAARISKLKSLKNDDDAWLVSMIKELADSEKDHDS